MLYFFMGKSLSVGGEAVKQHLAMHIDAQSDVELVNTGDDVVELVLLQGKPIGETGFFGGTGFIRDPDFVRFPEVKWFIR